ncbi:hypothetical protein [Aestuariivirga sp.]|uniref:hypothetical protein n=1 Tax=Aestuariivirga sp. TaxID=2650926 RepID=UPI0039E363B9
MNSYETKEALKKIGDKLSRANQEIGLYVMGMKDGEKKELNKIAFDVTECLDSLNDVIANLAIDHIKNK